MNYNNLHQKTNFTAGSDAFENIPFYLINVNVPGFSYVMPESGARGGARLNLAADTINYNSLSFDMLIDEDFTIYGELLSYLTSQLTLSKNSFSDNTFNFWVEINNNKGNNIAKFDFKNCRIESLGDIDLSTQDESTEAILNVSMRFDYFTFEKGSRTIPVLAT